MNLRLAIVDYGAGNLTSVRKAFRAIGCDVITAVRAETLEDAAGMIVPGVGHFAATAGITDEMREAIARRVEAGVPLLGICLGLQWLFEGSTEASGAAGLGVLPGRCTRLQADPPLKVPHVGWNTLDFARQASLTDGLAGGAHVYFTHSFAIAASGDAVATAVHGRRFVAAVQRGHICGVQFHPEKSGEAGLRILRNFVRMAGR